MGGTARSIIFVGPEGAAGESVDDEVVERRNYFVEVKVPKSICLAVLEYLEKLYFTNSAGYCIGRTFKSACVACFKYNTKDYNDTVCNIQYKTSLFYDVEV
ncbi:unnamed protein product [Lepeophtheirus salmonis]|uniref:(salmon louse) hypothetical protein n=1 Tax=Lepeophtheirus salmonis TaxID=72036 RepID=A0A817FCU3_LEPSM|nr:unnamed protein product [Lepeophtheirus salmonis]CAG9476877.1 unnamed protein product [Lepeophtheirus salmonis]